MIDIANKPFCLQSIQYKYLCPSAVISFLIHQELFRYILHSVPFLRPVVSLRYNLFKNQLIFTTMNIGNWVLIYKIIWIILTDALLTRQFAEVSNQLILRPFCYLVIASPGHGFTVLLSTHISSCQDGTGVCSYTVGFETFWISIFHTFYFKRKQNMKQS